MHKQLRNKLWLPLFAIRSAVDLMFYQTHSHARKYVPIIGVVFGVINCLCAARISSVIWKRMPGARNEVSNVSRPNAECVHTDGIIYIYNWIWVIWFNHDLHRRGLFENILSCVCVAPAWKVFDVQARNVWMFFVVVIVFSHQLLSTKELAATSIQFSVWERRKLVKWVIVSDLQIIEVFKKPCEPGDQYMFYWKSAVQQFAWK